MKLSSNIFLLSLAAAPVAARIGSSTNNGPFQLQRTHRALGAPAPAPYLALGMICDPNYIETPQCDPNLLYCHESTSTCKHVDAVEAGGSCSDSTCLSHLTCNEQFLCEEMVEGNETGVLAAGINEHCDASTTCEEGLDCDDATSTCVVPGTSGTNCAAAMAECSETMPCCDGPCIGECPEGGCGPFMDGICRTG
ncbi:expressed unknown protein [Seminavis robusta]|uniref:Uncharacterized protein n=1 Tax=Seminavis robusta TaxID=568900 RepID=A0A9N8DZZ8_9STRA|nr:expressed unknown protein [Seminavis robusta]|eukprot:Sro376_g129770.1 n/a (195) ;mRNA; r:44903-45487